MYRNIKAKKRETYKDFSYQSELTSMLCGMFKWKGLENPMYSNAIELTLHCLGSIGFTVRDGKQIIGTITRHGSIGYDGLGCDATLLTLNGESYTGKIGNDIFICYNNNLLMPTLQIDWTAYLLTEIDKSMSSVIRKARLNPIPTAKDSKAKKAIEDAMNATDNGEYKVVLDEDIAISELNGMPKINMLQVTDPSHMDKLQYLTKYRDDVIRQFWSKYGQPMRATGKMAQQSVEEITQEDDYCQILPNIMLNMRKDFCNAVNEAYNIGLSVSFSNAFVDEKLGNDGNVGEAGETGEAGNVDNIGKGDEE